MFFRTTDVWVDRMALPGCHAVGLMKKANIKGMFCLILFSSLLRAQEINEGCFLCSCNTSLISCGIELFSTGSAISIYN